MTDPETLEEYRSAFWLTFAEDHGLINEWQIKPSPIVETLARDRRLGGHLPGNSLGMVANGS